MADTQPVTGLGTDPKESWPAPPEPGTRPIDLLRPGSDQHAKVLAYLVHRIEASENAMSAFYSRWRVNELNMQAYITLTDYEKALEQMNKDKKPAQAISITVPYAFAAISTIVTYLLHTFCGRKPLFQLGTYKSETAEAARKMELVLQYNADHTRFIKNLYQFLLDTQVYGVGILRTQWKKETAKRTVRTKLPTFNFFGMQLGQRLFSSRATKTIYEGNEVCSQDPFLFFPDPRVPMTEVNKKGEFVFWRSFEGKHMAKRLEYQGVFKYVDWASTQMPHSRTASGGVESSRGLRAGGESTAGLRTDDPKMAHYYQVDQGTVEIIPRELGLGASEVPEKYLFTILNKSQIVQAEPFDADHNMHPVSCAEPFTQGYGFGNLGMADYLGPLQDTISWLVNSHIYNVRAALNNMLVVDPSMVEMQDIKNPDAGKLIRLKRAAYGQDVRAAIQQLAVQDVTASHIKDLETFVRLGQQLSGVNDNLMGLHEAGGRKTATEVRTSGEAGASRLAAMGRVISAQGLVDTSEQMVVNLQQYLSDEFYIQIVGEEGATTPLRISPEQIAGDFYYPIHDGTLPLDRVAMLDVWKEILMGVAQDPELRSQFSVPKIFEWVAQLGGAQNINSMRVNLQIAPPGQGPQGAPGMMPLPAPGGGAPGLPAPGGGAPQLPVQAR